VSVALVVGSFDPLIRGQVDLIARAARMCGRVVVAVESTPSHRPLLRLDERIERLERAFAPYPHIRVRALDVDLATFVNETRASVYVVALRGAADVEYVLAALQPLCDALGIELMALLAEPAHAFVTTALVFHEWRTYGYLRVDLTNSMDSPTLSLYY
jgi:pantetheine-phosphate adenylyltransferase